MKNKDVNYLSDILLRGIMAIRNNADENQSKKLTDNLLTESDWQVLAEYMQDAIDQSNVDYELIERQLIHFLKTDKYWIEWARNILETK